MRQEYRSKHDVHCSFWVAAGLRFPLCSTACVACSRRKDNAMQVSVSLALLLSYRHTLYIYTHSLTHFRTRTHTLLPSLKIQVSLRQQLLRTCCTYCTCFSRGCMIPSHALTHLRTHAGLFYLRGSWELGPYGDRVKAMPFLKSTSRAQTVVFGRRRWWDFLIPGAEWLR